MKTPLALTENEVREAVPGLTLSDDQVSLVRAVLAYDFSAIYALAIDRGGIEQADLPILDRVWRLWLLLFAVGECTRILMESDTVDVIFEIAMDNKDFLAACPSLIGRGRVLTHDPRWQSATDHDNWQKAWCRLFLQDPPSVFNRNGWGCGGIAVAANLKA